MKNSYGYVLEGFMTHNNAAEKAILRCYQTLVVELAIYLGADKSRAEDAAQQAVVELLKLHKRNADLPAEALEHYLTIAGKRAAARIAKESRIMRTDTDAPSDPLSSVFRGLVGSERDFAIIELQQKIEPLGFLHEAVFQLLVEGHDIHEIAEMTFLSPADINVCIDAIRQSLSSADKPSAELKL